MGIKSTQYITRSKVIERLTLMRSLFNENDYMAVQQETGEYDYSSYSLIQMMGEYKNNQYLNSTLTKLPNNILEDLLDLPFIRFSMFDNYIIKG